MWTLEIPAFPGIAVLDSCDYLIASVIMTIKKNVCSIIEASKSTQIIVLNLTAYHLPLFFSTFFKSNFVKEARF